MKFICLDIGTNPKADILKYLFTVKDTNWGDSLVTESGKNLLYQVLDTASDCNYIYVPERIAPIFKNRFVKSTPMTIAELSTETGLNIVNHSGFLDSFYWNFTSPAEIKSGFWFTILTESGFIFAQASTSLGTWRGIVDASQLIVSADTSRMPAYPETGNVAVVTGNVVKQGLSAVHFVAMARKQNGLSSLLTFTGDGNIEHLDYVSYKNNFYMVVDNKSGTYSAVLIDESTNTESGETAEFYDSIRAVSADNATNATNALQLSGFRFALVTTTIVSSTTTVSISLPDGFTRDNCVLLSAQVWNGANNCWVDMKSSYTAHATYPVGFLFRITAGYLWLNNYTGAWSGATAKFMFMRTA